MNTTPDQAYPAHTPPTPPRGTRWEYRGVGGTNDGEPAWYYCVTPGAVETRDYLRVPDGTEICHYFEAVPIPSPVTFPTLEAAVSAIGEKVLGARGVIEAPVTATPEKPTYRLLEDGEQIRSSDQWQDQDGQWRQREYVHSGERLNVGKNHTPHRRLVGEAPGLDDLHRIIESKDQALTALEEELASIKDATLKLRGIKAITAPDPARCIEQAAAVIQDKDATIKRLKDKLADAAAVMQDNIDLKAEVERLAGMLDIERTRLAACSVVALADTLESAVEARKMLPKYHSASCGDVERQVDECIKLRGERNALHARVAELEAALPAAEPQYRMLEVGETIVPSDEVSVDGNRWVEYGRMATVRPAGHLNPVGYYRRKIN